MNKGYYSDSSEFKGTGKRVVIILICVALLFGLMYFLTTRILSKEVTKKRKQSEVTESTIQYEKILADKDYLNKVLDDGAQKASYFARKTLSKVKRKMGVGR